MLRRVLAMAPPALIGRFASTEAQKDPSKTATFETSTIPPTVVSAAPSRGDQSELLAEYKKKAADPQGLPKTRAVQKAQGSDDHIYNRGRNDVPTPADIKSHTTSEHYRSGQITTRSTLHMMKRAEADAARTAAVSIGNMLPLYENPIAKWQGTAEYHQCSDINPLEHDLTYHGGKDLRYGTVKRQISGGTYLRL